MTIQEGETKGAMLTEPRLPADTARKDAPREPCAALQGNSVIQNQFHPPVSGLALFAGIARNRAGKEHTEGRQALANVIEIVGGSSNGFDSCAQPTHTISKAENRLVEVHNTDPCSRRIRFSRTAPSYWTTLDAEFFDLLDILGLVRKYLPDLPTEKLDF